jgi:2Fe-2S ferredoxin
MKLNVTDRDGAAHQLEGQESEVLMPLLRDGIDNTVGICGGVISCGTCLVRVDEAWADRLPEPSVDEAEMVEAITDEPRCRLACQIVLSADMDGLVLTIAPDA